ncbi:MAG: prephenate dehydrogenase [Bacteroidota bacterium]
MKPIRRVTIIGVGLIGGSLALVLKRRRPSLTIVGYDRAPVLTRALKLNAIDEAATDLLSAVIQSDCLIFATPISTTLEMIRRVGKFIPPDTIVSDVCSTKVAVMEVAKRCFPKEVLFVGGHPMAGSERSGIDSADPLLFENAYYILSSPRFARSEKRKKSQLKAFVRLIESTGARVVFLDPAIHDRVVASVSHVPQLLAVALMSFVSKQQRSPSLQLAAGGFRDLTRVASSPFDMWAEILTTNRKEVSRSLKRLLHELERYRSIIDSKRIEKLGGEFLKARKLRDSIPKDMKGFHRPLVDVFVSVEDKPGAMSKISTALYRHRINIKDIELLKVREGETGTFRLSFETQKAANQAINILQKTGYSARRR